MLTYTVSRSIQIDKSPTEVIDYLSDFTTWPKWSPWLIMEPNCRVEFSSFQQQPGAVYGWDGRLVGEGRIELEHLTDERIDAVI
ncbi:SRPBCC family protein [Vibrio sp.]|uniref:SRPBCC family protein n=1 Tax=Vibrio sp. TaxID=678 RepID=UPI003D101BD2